MKIYQKEKLFIDCSNIIAESCAIVAIGRVTLTQNKSMVFFLNGTSTHSTRDPLKLKYNCCFHRYAILFKCTELNKISYCDSSFFNRKKKKRERERQTEKQRDKKTDRKKKRRKKQ